MVLCLTLVEEHGRYVPGFEVYKTGCYGSKIYLKSLTIHSILPLLLDPIPLLPNPSVFKMPSKTTVLAAMAGAIASVSAHGYVDEITIDGESYKGYKPTDAPWEPEQDSIGWQNWATDTGFVASSLLQTEDIICHINSTNAPKVASVAAGSEITLQWTDWPDSHHGPVVDYLASCGGDCTSVDKLQLRFFKIAEMGQIELGEGEGEPGYWASDKFIEDGTWQTYRNISPLGKVIVG